MLDPGLEPHQYLYTGMWMKLLSCHAGYQGVSRCCTRGESEEYLCTQVTKHVSEGIHPGFEIQGSHHQKSKTGISVALLNGLMSSKRLLFFKIDFFHKDTLLRCLNTLQELQYFLP